MRDALIRRRDALKEELERGRAAIAEREKDIEQLRRTLLRIEGAIQVLEEEIAAGGD